jgi:hypothetical protein
VNYYKRDGTLYTGGVVEWSQEFERANRIVAHSRLWWGGRVSTIWLGIDHNFSGTGPPLIFETMVFPPRSWGELDMERYPAEAKALKGHEFMVRYWNSPLFLAAEIAKRAWRRIRWGY